MSLAASLLMLAAAAVPQAATSKSKPLAPTSPSAPAPPAPHGVVATAQATAVILRPAVVRSGPPGARGDGWWQNGDTFFRQTHREGRHVTVDFN